MKATIQNIDDETAERIGAELAVALRLKRDPEHKDRWMTTWGTKTNKGLARSIAQVFCKNLASTD